MHRLPRKRPNLFIAESRRGATRRRNTLSASLGAGLLVALGLAGIAYWQRNIAVEQRSVAETERTRAERNFGAAKSTIDSVVFDMALGLRDVEGMQAQTARRILDRAEAAVTQLASRTENESEVRRSQAAMFTEFAETYGRLGATDLARSYARRGLEITRDLADASGAST
jgi:hypothetical protein